MLPITDALYLGVAMWLVAVAGLAGARTAAQRVLAASMGIGGLAVCSLAFARYWGSAEGLVVAVLLGLMLVALVGAMPRRIAWRVALIDVAWLIGLVVIALATVLAVGPAASVSPVAPYEVGGLDPVLRPVEDVEP